MEIFVPTVCDLCQRNNAKWQIRVEGEPLFVHRSCAADLRDSFLDGGLKVSRIMLNRTARERWLAGKVLGYVFEEDEQPD